MQKTSKKIQISIKFSNSLNNAYKITIKNKILQLKQNSYL